MWGAPQGMVYLGRALLPCRRQNWCRRSGSRIFSATRTASARFFPPASCASIGPRRARVERRRYLLVHRRGANAGLLEGRGCGCPGYAAGSGTRGAKPAGANRVRPGAESEKSAAVGGARRGWRQARRRTNTRGRVGLAPHQFERDGRLLWLRRPGFAQCAHLAHQRLHRFARHFGNRLAHRGQLRPDHGRQRRVVEAGDGQVARNVEPEAVRERVCASSFSPGSHLSTNSWTLFRPDWLSRPTRNSAR